MTAHEKAIYIIQQLELSDSKVARAIGKSKSTTTHKRMNLRGAKFSEEEFTNLRDFYLEKFRKIEML
jgi:hypothetical protein